jgi:peroxiredoxin
MQLDRFGPAIWQPFAAPALDAKDSTGRPVSLDQFRGRNVILVFYLGAGCAHCVLQLKDLSERAERWKNLDAEVIAVSTDSVESNAMSQPSLGVRLLSDPGFANARRFKAYDDFEQMPIHSTILIDRNGRLHWGHHGGAPFTDYDFLASQLQRLNAMQAPAGSPPPAQR